VKKVLAILLLGFYVSLNAISAISMHYCHGNLVDVAINKSAESCCGSDANSKSCCNDFYLEVDFDDERVIRSSTEIDGPVQVQTFFVTSECVLFFEETNQTQSYKTSNPPGKEFTDLYLLTSAFLFYS